MGKNLDPAGAVPEEDASGCLSLAETNTNFIQAALSTFIFGCLALGSLFFWYAYLAQGGAPQVTNVTLRTLGFMGIAALPFLPFLVANLLYPPSLTINDDGITARNWGRTRRLLWSDIQAINLRQITVNRYGNTKTQTIILGGTTRIRFLPLFGIAPATLADYINQRRNKASPGFNIAVGSAASKQNMAYLPVTGMGVAALFVVFLYFLKHHGIS